MEDMFENHTSPEQGPESNASKIKEKIGVYRRFIDEMQNLGVAASELEEAELRLRELRNEIARLEPSEELGVAINLEEVKTRLTTLHNRAEELRQLAKQSGENIEPLNPDDPSFENRVDHGYLAELEDEVLPEIGRLESILREADDVAASQRNLF